MDYMSFKKSRIKTNCSSQKAESANDDIRETAEKYAQKNDPDLLREILQAANNGKKDGSLSEEKLRQFVTSVSPMLNDEQRARLNSVVEMINKN